MTDPDLPRAKLERMAGDIGLALRLSTALNDRDADAANRVVEEICGDDHALALALHVACTAASMLARAGYELGLRTGHTADSWLHALACGFLDGVQQQLDADGGE